MDVAQGLSTLVGIGLASGLNVYAVVLTVGVAQRLGWLHGLPEGLALMAHPAVLTVAGVLYAAEFVADKVPGFTPFWDGVHTIIRPMGAALIALGAFGNMDPLTRTIAMLVAGSLALGSHATKMGTRLAAHSVPDPVTHSAISVAEDFSVVGIMLLAINYPWVALPILGVMVVGIAIAVPFLWRVIAFLLRTMRGRLLSFDRPNGDEIPDWARNGEGTVLLGFIRSGKGLGRLKRAYWRPGPADASLRVRGWLGSKAVALRPDGRRVEGLVLDYVELTTAEGAAVSLYLTKDWTALYREAM